MPKLTDDLATLYSQYVARQSEDLRTLCRQSNREYSRKIDRLAKQSIITVADFIAQLPRLSRRMKYFAIQLISCLKIRQAIPVLVEWLDDRAVRVACADALCWMNAGKKVTQLFIEIGRRELESEKPDRHWLEAVIYGLGGFNDDPGAAELLVSIFERVDLPGWIRGDAGDKLGCVEIVHDRRTNLFRRCRDAALRGLLDDSIEAAAADYDADGLVDVFITNPPTLYANNGNGTFTTVSSKMLTPSSPFHVIGQSLWTWILAVAGGWTAAHWHARRHCGAVLCGPVVGHSTPG